MTGIQDDSKSKLQLSKRQGRRPGRLPRLHSKATNQHTASQVATNRKPLLDTTVLLLDSIRLTSRVWRWTGDISNWKRTAAAGRTRAQRSGRFSTLDADSPLERRYYHDEQTDWNIDVKGKVLRLFGSVRRIIHPATNLKPVTTADVPAVLAYLDTIKGLLGLSFDITTLKVWRADAAVDVKVKDCAAVVREPSRVTRFNKLSLSSEKYATSIRWDSGNHYKEPQPGQRRRRRGAQRALSIYDKSAEQLAHNRTCSPNLLRVEYKLLRAQSCRRADIRTLSDLLSPEVQRAAWFKVCSTLTRAARRHGLKGDVWKAFTIWVNSMQTG